MLNFPINAQFKITQTIFSEIGKNIAYFGDFQDIVNHIFTLELYTLIVSIIALNGSGVVINN